MVEEARAGLANGRVPTERLIAHLKLTQWHQPAPLRGSLPGSRRMTIPLKQHVGAPASCQVQPGEVVGGGDPVGQDGQWEVGSRGPQ